jgi:hypothetical protein
MFMHATMQRKTGDWQRRRDERLNAYRGGGGD